MLQDGAKIQVMRKKKKGLTQTEMADHLGITQSSYHRIEKESIDVDLETIQKIAKKLETDPKQIINEKEALELQRVFNQNIENNFGSANSGIFGTESNSQVVEAVQDLRKMFETLQGAVSVWLEKLPK